MESHSVLGPVRAAMLALSALIGSVPGLLLLSALPIRVYNDNGRLIMGGR